MANVVSQATQIRDLLIERLEAYDPTQDLSPGSSAYDLIVGPVFNALSSDPFDMEIEEFLKTRLRQEYPSLSAQNGDAIVDIVIRPIQLLLESFKREIQIIRTGQSVKNTTNIRLQDAEDLAANFFVTRRTGARATGTVRIFFSTPTFVTILVSTRLSAGSLGFFPTVPQFFRPDVVAAQRSGGLYYVDIAVVAEAPGEEYNIAAGAITGISGLDSAVRATNLFSFTNGAKEETGPELLQRTRSSLTERSLNTRRGIRARIFSDFPSVRNLEVVGFGDPEMQRDKITGAGGGDVVCSGMSLILGRYMFLVSMFESRGRDGTRRIRDGGTVELNFWSFLYGTQKVTANQRFLVESVLYESSSDIEGVPTIYILRLNQSPEVDAPPGSMVPGLLPGVFAVAYDQAELRISGIPGGITNPDDNGEIVIRDDQVHVGGRYDVFVRPSRSNEITSTLTSASSEVALVEGETLCTVSSADLPLILKQYGAVPNKVNARLRLRLVSVVGSFLENEAVHRYQASTPDLDTGAQVLKTTVSSSGIFIDVVGLTVDNVWTIGTAIKGYTSEAVAVVSAVEQTLWEDLGVTRGMTLTVINSPDNGNYKILEVRGPELVLDSAMTATGGDYRFRVVDEVVIDAFEPKAPLYPFSGQDAGDLRTIIGVQTVRVGADLISFGATAGSILEILDGSNVGVYRITGFDPVLRGRGPILESAMTATDSNVAYRVFAGGSGLSRPLVRISPQGMLLQTASSQSTGYSVPPALPVGARALDGFSGAQEIYRGLNGFVFPDAGREWAPTDHTRLRAYDVDSTGAKSGTSARSPAGTITAADLQTITEYSGRPGTCYTDECLPTDDDFVAVITLTQDPTSSSGHIVQNHLSISLPTDATAFLQKIRTWLVDLTTRFELGDDFRAFFDLFAPFSLDPVDPSHTILAQYEILIPRAMFDGCNNLFFATPEFDWKSAFSESTTFADAMDLYNNGEIRNTPPALSRAKAGDVLTIDHGSNAGSYIIEKVYTYTVYHGGCILTSESSSYLDARVAYTFSIVQIKNEFPVNPFRGLSSFSPSAATSLSLAGPSFNVTSAVAAGPRAGDPLSPWLVVQESFTWFFQLLSSAGYDLPDQLVVHPQSVLQKIVAGFFDQYVVSHPTAEQIVRMYFTEPTSVTVYGPSPCSEYSWNEQQVEHVAEVTGVGEVANLSDIDEENAPPLVIHIQDVNGAVRLLSAEMPEGISGITGDEAGGEALIALLQGALDPDLNDIVFSVSASSGGSVSWMLTITSVNPAILRMAVAAANPSDDGFHLLGFSDVSSTEASWEPGELQVRDLEPHAPTLFSTPVGAEELLFVATATEAPLQVVPGATATGAVLPTSLPRDLNIYPHYDEATAFRMYGTDLLLPSFIGAGVRAGSDIIRIYEQKVPLEIAGSGSEDFSEKRDRVVVVTTQAGSSTLRLPRLTSGSAEFSFLSPSSEQDADVVRVGDYVFIEEGDGRGGYRISEVGDDYIKVDSVMPVTTGVVYRSGNEGSFTSGTTTFTDPSASFTTADVGRYLTIYASNYEEVDGSFQILSVSSDRTSVTVDIEEFLVTETGVHWCVVKAPVDDIEASSIGGKTELVGVRPIRIYSGVPSEWRVVDVHPSLERSESVLTCAYRGARLDSPFARQRDLETIGPVRGVAQPYEIVRPHVVHMSSTQMRSQGTENGLFYMDVRAHSLGGRRVYNIQKDTSLTPVFGTYDSDGYRMEVEDSLYTYSPAEKCKIYFSSSFLPNELNDSADNRAILNGASFSVRHEISQEVGQVQALLSSNLNRTLCADPLARHFLPSYVYLDIQVAAGNRKKVADEISAYINSLEPTDVLDISLLEKFLHSNNVGSYRHPIILQIVTHDLDRRRVLTRSSDQIGLSEGDFHGSHRTTFYIPGVATTTELTSGRERILVRALTV
jgi:hypothetical protein